jgi:hypothetical protein
MALLKQYQRFDSLRAAIHPPPTDCRLCNPSNSNTFVTGQVVEAEPPAPKPDHVLLMLQVNDTVTDKATMESELQVGFSFCVFGCL